MITFLFISTVIWACPNWGQSRQFYKFKKRTERKYLVEFMCKRMKLCQGDTFVDTQATITSEQGNDRLMNNKKDG